MLLIDRGLDVHARRQDRDISLSHLRNHHLTATESALTTVGTRNRPAHPGTVSNRSREAGIRVHP